MGKDNYYNWRFFAVLTILVFASPLSVLGQKRCSTMEYEAYRRNQNPKMETSKIFENWLVKRIAHKKFTTPGAKTSAAVVTIPVVVHVVHMGEPVGQGSNISDAQIISQIEVLNEDFRRLNSDASETLPVFAPVADDMEIEFTLAKQTPEGLPTDGIVRVLSDQSSYGLRDAIKLSNLSYWPAEDYLNIWVTTLGSSLLGFAQFPVSSLEGLEDASNNRLTDGLVMRYQSFGSNTKGTFPSLIAPYDRGRTATHEMGHFFGLRHIWGDGNCSQDDFCLDTPSSSSEHEGCNLARESCGQLSMVQNYMDYTDDVCMNLFTSDQKERMRTVLESSPRRQSLTTSSGAIDPSLVTDDLGVKSVINPSLSQCGTTFTPTIEVRNYGTNDITAARVNFSVNGVVVESIDVNLSLAPLDTDTLTFSTVNDINVGSNDILFEVIETNGIPDNNPANNTQSLTYIVNTERVTSINETFEIFPTDWIVVNADASTTWLLQSAPGISQNNKAMMIDYFGYEDALGEIDRLISPPLDFSNASSISLTFRYAYVNRNDQQDRLTVAMSTNCGSSFENIIFDEVGPTLATSDAQETAFVPEDKSHWKKISINLDDFAGAQDVRLAFDAQNGEGNNLYLDDVVLEMEQQYDTDISIKAVLSPAAISCNNTFVPGIQIENPGRLTVSNFTAQYSIDGVQQATVEALSLNPGEEMTVEFPEITLADGQFEFDFQIVNPSGQTDQNPENNQVIAFQSINNTTEEAPIREVFKNTDLENTGWQVVNPDRDKTWLITPAAGNGINNNAAYINGYDYETTGEEDWLVSPVLDFGGANEASLTFKFSYANVNNYNDLLKIRVSRDCGETFDDPIYVKQSVALGVTTSSQPWVPAAEEDWRSEFVNLDSYAGYEQVRLAFVFENQFGNNLYIDDIEFFLTSDRDFPVPETNSFVIYPNPVINDNFNASFNLANKEDIHLAIFDSKGQVVYERNLEKTLNQTYTLELPQLINGVYFVKTAGTSLNDVQKLLIQK
ncbi:choice-of-anchor J domain-containing protein [Fulvivirgaceae bacterium BMA12]|uniref:Choice-of-anchor J domain-containing protein n=1 Tax=Agaribacillus aureus TaxID=3051825 RepID=A0ABT8L0B4_9BACT|nr:choice-of-anchor J domain-containing protein [Fulvivirgaceae bacterium BMA12]